jgi:hypothetical protein
MSSKDFPQEVKACLWSYDTSRIDILSSDHRQRIIENVLNRGTKAAVDWVFSEFSREELAHAITKSSLSVWNKKSLALWSLILQATPARASRFI